jgi:hypothetical protein
MDQLQQIIEQAFERRADITPRNVDAQLKEAVGNIMWRLAADTGAAPQPFVSEGFSPAVVR